LAYGALKRGGNMPCVLNAANEVAVAEFLDGKAGFLQMSDVVEHCLSKMDYITDPAYEDYVETDRKTRIKAREFLGN
jgi:1-deoxy-D-xylulose-5-phosphate reductoisomerase